MIERLELRGDEMVLDAGCGSGKVTGMLLDRLPHGRVIAVDAAPSMIAKAREALAGRPATVIESSLTDLVLERAGGRGLLQRRLPPHRRPRPALRSACTPRCGPAGGSSRSAGARATSPASTRSPARSRRRGPGRSISRAGAGRGTSPVPARPRSACARPASAEAELLARALAGASRRARRRSSRRCAWARSSSRCRRICETAYLQAVLREAGEPLELDYVRLNIVARA